jgi:Asp-tRNA(Asn)/Glu-tRNA(Gln) amidotransferase A subunit family amidase
MLDAEAVAHVVEEGASIVGKTTLSSFLSREEATESIDYQIA